MAKVIPDISFAKTVTDELAKEIVAFLNTKGGTIYIGMDENGNMHGLSDSALEIAKLNKIIETLITPNPIFYITSSVITKKKIKMVEIKIDMGPKKPYHLSSNRANVNEVYVREEFRTVPATEYAVSNMILETDNINFEKEVSKVQNLTFTYTKKLFEKNYVFFDEERMRELLIKNENGSYTNLALIISDQNRFQISCNIYSDATNRKVFKSKDFKGSIFEQIEKVMKYLLLLNKTEKSKTDVSYPEEALYEALINALVHKDYSNKEPILINIFTDKIEYISQGGLPLSADIKKLRRGISVPRNFNLYEVFKKLKFIKGLGGGIPKIFDSYMPYKHIPKIEGFQNSFITTLFNINSFPGRLYSGTYSNKLNGIQNKIVLCMLRNPYFMQSEIITELDISKAVFLKNCEVIKQLNILEDNFPEFLG